MPQDDQHLLDVIAEYSQDIRKATGDILDETDRYFALVAHYIKKSVPQTWLPEYARPAPPPPPLQRVHGVPAAFLPRLQDWISRNRALTAALVVFFGTGGYLLYRESRKHKRRRRAPRASNGARTEVVVIAGAPNSPIVKSLSMDLERRGFIVYVVCADQDEEQQVKSQSRADVRPLHLDVVDALGTQEAMDRFSRLLARPNPIFPGLKFNSLILVPDLIYPSGPIETIPPELWSDALNAKVLNTIALTQTFLPTVCSFKARVLMLTPSIVSSLRPPFHSVETAVVSALEGFTASLRGELGTLGIDVCQFKLGTFDFSHVGAKQHLQTLNGPNTDVWSTAARQSYASNYVNQSRVARNRGLFTQSEKSGSSMRELHNAVFDAMTQRRPRRVWRVGRGSVMYDVAGSWLPGGLVGWMLGVRRVALDETAGQPLDESSSAHSWENVKVETAI